MPPNERPLEEEPKSEVLAVREEEKLALENEELPRALLPRLLLSKLESAWDDETVEPAMRPEFEAERLPCAADDEDALLRAPPKELQPAERPELAAEEVPRSAVSLELRFDVAERLLLPTPDEPLFDEFPNECQFPSATAGRAFEGIRPEVL